MTAGGERAGELRRQAAAWPSYTLDPAALSDVELLLTGAFAPLRCYLGPRAAAAIRRQRRLPDGGPFPVPVTLAVPAEVAERLAGGVGAVRDGAGAPADPAGPRLALRDPEGVLLAVVMVSEIAAVTEGAADRDGTLARLPGPDGSSLIAGPVEGVALPTHHDFVTLRRPPEPAGRRLLVVSDPVGYQSTAPARRLAERLGARLALVPACAPHGPDDAAFAARARGLRDDARPGEQAMVLETRWCGPDLDGTLARAWIARSYGATDLGVAPEHRDAVARLLPEVAVHSLTADRQAAQPGRGLMVLFTGLSGSGKSTVARALVGRLLEDGDRPVTLLDGDVVRRHLSSELGFSRQDRDTNVRRIGWVGAQVAKHGGIAVCAPIAPYDATRRDVRATVEAVGTFVLVHVATPLDVCEARDRKGLYARARSGAISEFTGISDPYEPPADADVVLDTSELGVDEAAASVLDYLTAAGLLD
jgi:sulfate adenylyltransferase